MDVKSLYLTSFSDTEAFADFFVNRSPMHTVTVEENGETVGIAFLLERKLTRDTTDADGLPVGFVSGVCVKPDDRGKGYGKRVMERVAEQARALGMVALYLSPDVPAFYNKLGYRDVAWYETVPVRTSACKARCRCNPYRAFSFKTLPEKMEDKKQLIFALIQIIKSSQTDCIALEYTEADVARLCDEIAVDGEGWLITDKKGICGFCVREDNIISRIFLAKKLNASRVLSRARAEDGTPAFAGCMRFTHSVAKRSLRNPAVFLQELALDADALTAFTGNTPYNIIERY